MNKNVKMIPETVGEMLHNEFKLISNGWSKQFLFYPLVRVLGGKSPVCLPLWGLGLSLNCISWIRIELEFVSTPKREAEFLRR